jgi:hypothetical protein
MTNILILAIYCCFNNPDDSKEIVLMFLFCIIDQERKYQLNIIHSNSSFIEYQFHLWSVGD